MTTFADIVAAHALTFIGFGMSIVAVIFAAALVWLTRDW